MLGVWARTIVLRAVRVSLAPSVVVSREGGGVRGGGGGEGGRRERRRGGKEGATVLRTARVSVAPSVVESLGMAVVDGQGAQLQCAVRGSPLPAVVWLREDTDAVFEEGDEEVSDGDDDRDHCGDNYGGGDDDSIIMMMVVGNNL